MSKKLLIEGTWVILTNILAFVASFIVISITASKLSVAGYGSLALIFTLQAFFNIILFGSINNGVQRFSPVSKELEKFRSFFSSTLKIGLIFSILVIILFFIFSLIFLLLNKSNWIYPLGLAIFISIFLGLSEFIVSIIISIRNRKLVFIFKLIDSLFKILLLIYYKIENYLDILEIYLISSVLYYLILLGNYRKTIDLKNFVSLSLYEKYWIKKMYLYSIPFILWGIFGWFQQSSIKWSMDFFLDRDSVGNFNALIQISYTPVLLIYGTVSSFLTPIYFQKIKINNVDSKSKNLLNKIISFSFISVIIVIIGSIILYSIGGQLLTLVFPLEYLVILDYMPVSFLAAGLFAIGSFITTIPFSLGKSEAVLSSSIAGSIIGILSAFIFVYFFGFMGGVMALLTHGFSHLTLTYFRVKKML